MMIKNKSGDGKMKLNRELMKEMSKKNDAELWDEIRRIAAEKGFSLKDIKPSHEDLEKVRSMLSGNEKINVADAMRLANKYKSGGK